MRSEQELRAAFEQVAADLPDLSDNELTGLIHAARRLQIRRFWRLSLIISVAVAGGLAAALFAKLEAFNPASSVKDRIALLMVQDAEERGLIGPGGTIVEPTSGNTGVGLALVAVQRGYRCVFTMPDKISAEKVNVLRAYGAEVIVCPTAVAPDDPD